MVCGSYRSAPIDRVLPSDRHHLCSLAAGKIPAGQTGEIVPPCRSVAGTAFDIGVPDTQIFDVPMELGLELVAIVGSDFSDTERELVDDVIDEVDHIGLCMFFIDFQGANAGRIINRRTFMTSINR